MSRQTHTLEVWGDLACFTRPEMKVERFSYPVITPSAARGIFDAIYWEGIRDTHGMKPYFHWQVERVEVLEMPRYIALRRNEVKGRVPGTAKLNKWMNGKETPEPLWADGDDETTGRTQRQTMALRMRRLTARVIPNRSSLRQSRSTSSTAYSNAAQNRANVFNSLSLVAVNSLPSLSMSSPTALKDSRSLLTNTSDGCFMTYLTCGGTSFVMTNPSSRSLMPRWLTVWLKFRPSRVRRCGNRKGGQSDAATYC